MKAAGKGSCSLHRQDRKMRNSKCIISSTNRARVYGGLQFLEHSRRFSSYGSATCLQISNTEPAKVYFDLTTVDDVALTTAVDVTRRLPREADSVLSVLQNRFGGKLCGTVPLTYTYIVKLESKYLGLKIVASLYRLRDPGKGPDAIMNALISVEFRSSLRTNHCETVESMPPPAAPRVSSVLKLLALCPALGHDGGSSTES